MASPNRRVAVPIDGSAIATLSARSPPVAISRQPATRQRSLNARGSLAQSHGAGKRWRNCLVSPIPQRNPAATEPHVYAYGKPAARRPLEGARSIALLMADALGVPRALSLSLAFSSPTEQRTAVGQRVEAAQRVGGGHEAGCEQRGGRGERAACARAYCAPGVAFPSAILPWYYVSVVS